MHFSDGTKHYDIVQVDWRLHQEHNPLLHGMSWVLSTMQTAWLWLQTRTVESVSGNRSSWHQLGFNSICLFKMTLLFVWTWSCLAYVDVHWQCKLEKHVRSMHRLKTNVTIVLCKNLCTGHPINSKWTDLFFRTENWTDLTNRMSYCWISILFSLRDG